MSTDAIGTALRAAFDRVGQRLLTSLLAMASPPWRALQQEAS